MLELVDPILELLGRLFALVDLLLVVSFAGVQEGVLEQLVHLVELLAHFDDGRVYEAFQLLGLLLSKGNRLNHFLMQLLDDK